MSPGYISFAFTAARWPNFRPNDSKEVRKNFHGRKKFEAIQFRKKAGKYFYNHLGGEKTLT
jgi:hypothetical protein